MYLMDSNGLHEFSPGGGVGSSSQTPRTDAAFAECLIVLEGTFSVASDRAALVDTILGVWAVMLFSKLGCTRQIARLRRLINENRQRAFPAQFFDDLVEQLELLVVASKAMSSDEIENLSFNEKRAVVALDDMVGKEKDELVQRGSQRSNPLTSGRLARSLRAWWCVFSIKQNEHETGIAECIRSCAARLQGPMERFERLCWLRVVDKFSTKPHNAMEDEDDDNDEPSVSGVSGAKRGVGAGARATE